MLKKGKTTNSLEMLKEILFTFIFAVTCFLFGAKKNKKKRFLNKIKLLNFTFFIVFFSFFFLIFLNTPVIRISHHVFLIFFLLPFLFLPYYNFSNNQPEPEGTTIVITKIEPSFISNNSLHILENICVAPAFASASNCSYKKFNK